MQPIVAFFSLYTYHLKLNNQYHEKDFINPISASYN